MRHPERSQTRLALIATVTTAAIVILVAGCDASTKGAAMTRAAAAPSSAPAGMIDAGAEPAGGVTGAEAAASSSAGPAAPPGSAPASAAAGSTFADGPVTTQPSILTARQVVYTADITVRTKDIKAAVNAVQGVADGHAGIVFAEQVNLMPKDPDSSGLASATITLRVPPASLTAVLAQVSALGVELGRNQHAEDVTSQVVDVEARATAAQNSLKRLNELFARAGTVAELTSLEQQIAQREADRDSLLSQQKTLAAQVAQATITVNLVGTPAVAAAIVGPKKAHVFGFLRGLRGGWHAFGKAASGFATGVGAVLPFVVVLLMLGLVGLIVRRRFAAAHRDDMPRGPQTPTADPAS